MIELEVASEGSLTSCSIFLLPKAADSQQVFLMSCCCDEWVLQPVLTTGTTAATTCGAWASCSWNWFLVRGTATDRWIPWGWVKMSEETTDLVTLSSDSSDSIVDLVFRTWFNFGVVLTHAHWLCRENCVF